MSRKKGIDPTKRKAFMDALGKGLNPTDAMRDTGMSANEMAHLLDYIEAANLVLTMRAELREGVKLTAEHLEAIRLVTMPIVDVVNELSAEVERLNSNVLDQAAELQLLRAALGTKDLETARPTCVVVRHAGKLLPLRGKIERQDAGPTKDPA